MQINPYLNFNGNCAEAFKFYEKCFGGKIEMMMTHKDAPPEANMSPDWGDKILHVRLNVNGAILLGSDAPANFYHAPQGMTVSLMVDKPEEAQRIFKELAVNGNVTMALQQTFWAKQFGMVTDRFSTPWMVNCPNI
ncbi:MAG TPA: VOC family protein [Rhizomicrobium sp.]|jgi:PhnB protein